nr:AI-2E family transporter [Pseudopedobacter sp.]
MEINKWLSAPFYVKLMCVLVSLICIGYLVILGRQILSPMVFSCLFSILLLPLAVFMEKKLKLPRSAASMLSVILLLAIVALIIYIIGSQISNLASDWPQFQDQLHQSLEHLQNWISQTFHINARKQLNYVHTATSKVMDSGTTVVGTTILSFSGILLFILFTFIYTFFFLLYRTLIMRFLESVFLEHHKKLVHDVIEEVQYMIRKYITGLLIEMIIVAFSVSIVFLLLGVKYAILLGLIADILNLIPYIGILTALIISSAITFATSTEISQVVFVMITIFITHIIDSNILLPLVVGSKVRINALVTVLGVMLGELIWGIPGMFLSIPITAVLKIIFDRVEGLKAWGLILGEEPHKESQLTKKLGIKKKR